MNRYEIHLKDFARILFGNAPPIFLLEVLIRAIITYALLLVVARWMGKRMTGELTLMEMAVMVTLGAIVSTPMQAPDRGILQGLVLLLCAVGFQRGVSYLGYRSSKFEDLTQGTPSLMVKDGVLQLDVMRNDRISREQLLAVLRQQNVYNLGVAERIYLEPSGSFSIYKSSVKQPGLPLFPVGDEVQKDSGQAMATVVDDVVVCSRCGTIKPKTEAGNCSYCGENDFDVAVI